MTLKLLNIMAIFAFTLIEFRLNFWYPLDNKNNNRDPQIWKC